MRISSLTLTHFRGFESLELRLPPEGPAVLIGVNGAGKSSVLDAIGMLLSTFTALAFGDSVRRAEVKLSDGDIKIGHEGVVVDATVRMDEEDAHWGLRSDRSRRSPAAKREILRGAQVLQKNLALVRDINIPVLCFYSANRALASEVHGEPTTAPYPQLQAYDRAFRHGVGAFQDFVRWFRLEEDLENQVRLRERPEHRNPSLEVVRSALTRFLQNLGGARFSDLRIERSAAAREGSLVINKDGVPLRIEQLSEGEKNTLLLVSDLARRLSIANPRQENALLGEGIVLIDEIDLHLHPGWQREILPALGETFPGIQFIVSTHSPQVLSRIPREHVFILENFGLVRVTPPTYGHDASSILAEVMGLSARPKDVEEKIRNAARLIDEERIDEAKAALNELIALLGEEDADMVRLRALLGFLDG
ncbi:AAA family ATPase [Polyangium sp. y55x31]|uniref:AAA family ATPase n=1 Tax=Polyangium sp. y55x31 TaxID=3042688 RepID=UPI002482DEB2|nr:AAA family ATPase [Polyangium sp. y55x31]MDI1484097.1 AAA family ATPase [Polyangium sp. y55x31]